MNKKRSLVELKERFAPELKKCELCESKFFLPFQQYGRIGKTLEYGKNQILICSKCSYKMQNPRFPNAFYKEYYSKAYREICFGFSAPDKAYIEEQKERGYRVLNYCKKYFKHPCAVLDHGSASGGALIPFKESGWDTFGVDPNEASIESGRRDLKIDIRLGVGEELPFQSNSVDLVISLGSLEHSYDIGLTLKEIKRVLKEKSGILFIRWRSDKLWGSPLEYYNHNHHRFFTDKTLELLLLLNGFKVIEHNKFEIERKPGEVYTIAKSIEGNTKNEFDNILQSYEKQNLSLEEMNKHAIYKLNYLKRSSEFISLWNDSKKDYVEFANQIRSKKKSKHRILLGDEKWAINRALDEAKSFISEWERGNTF